MQSQKPELAFGHFEMPDETTDVIFVVQDKKLYFNKALLMIGSQVFKRMFKETEVKEIPLPGRKYEAVVVFFEQMHPVYCSNPITETSLKYILPLADVYKAERILQKCDQFIVAQIAKAKAKKPTQFDILFYLWLCDKHRHKHRKVLLHLAAQRKSWELHESQYYTQLSETTRLEIMTYRCEKLDEYMYRDCQKHVCFLCVTRLPQGLEDHLQCSSCCSLKNPTLT